MTLIVVESPTKARTFARILKDKGYQIIATVGHFRDLPKLSIGIHYDQQFRPEYEISERGQKMLAKLLDLARQHDKIILATDPDREGESIAYHVAYVLGFVKNDWPEIELEPQDKLSRIVFHEITPKAIEKAISDSGSLRINLVHAQQARRILDRIVGYEISPLLWKKTGKNWLSAGRVQSVALRLIVEREKEIKSFSVEKYYKIWGNFNIDGQEVRALLKSKANKVYEETIKMSLFVGDYQYTKTCIDAKLKDELIKELEQEKFTILKVVDEEVERFPPPPFSTSLLQQEAYHKFGFPAKLTMKVAQELFENGLITYHRTDSFNLSSQFVFRAKDYIIEKFGVEYALEKPRVYKTKSKIAQEAHEAIRPTHLEANPAKVNKKAKVSTNGVKLYKLIFERAVASQMQPARIMSKQLEIVSSGEHLFEAVVQKITFHGFLKLLNPKAGEKYTFIDKASEGELVSLTALDNEELETNPPFRYTEASLIRVLEDKGVGRPSTYASIISLIQDKQYVLREMGSFRPSNLGVAISEYVSHAFQNLFDLDFTARLEDDLDKIASGEKKILDVLQGFFSSFKRTLDTESQNKEKIIVAEEKLEGEVCPSCGGDLVLKMSRFGKFYACKNYPKCKYIKPNLHYIEGAKCPKCGSGILIRRTKAFKRFYGCEKYPDCDFVAWTLAEAKGETPSIKPKVAIIKTMEKTTEARTTKNLLKNAKSCRS